jgi:hypothetical protein
VAFVRASRHRLSLSRLTSLHDLTSGDHKRLASHTRVTTRSLPAVLGWQARDRPPRNNAGRECELSDP